MTALRMVRSLLMVGDQDARGGRADAGHRGEQIRRLAPSRGFAHGVVVMALDVLDFGAPPGDVVVQLSPEARVA